MCCSTCKIRHVQPSCGTSPDLQNSRRAALCLTRHFTALNCARRLHRLTAFSLKISAACVRSPNPVSPLNRGIGSLEVVNAADQALRRGRRHFFSDHQTRQPRRQAATAVRAPSHDRSAVVGNDGPALDLGAAAPFARWFVYGCAGDMVHRNP